MKYFVSGQPDKIHFNASAEVEKNNNKMAGNHNMREKQPAGKSSIVRFRQARDFTRHVERESNVDREKVNAIKAAINAGTYLVDADTIAAKLMELEVKLAKKKGDT